MNELSMVSILIMLPLVCQWGIMQCVYGADLVLRQCRMGKIMDNMVIMVPVYGSNSACLYGMACICCVQGVSDSDRLSWGSNADIHHPWGYFVE